MAVPEVERRLAAILAADVAGYSRLMGADEEGTLKVLTLYRGVMTQLIEEHQGRVVVTAGDSMLAEFGSAVQAVRSAVAVQRALDRRNVVLDRMAALNIISREKADKIKGKNLGLKLQKFSAGCVSTRAPFFCDFVIDWLSKDARLGKTVSDRLNLLQTGGLTIKTTVNVGMQRVADRAVSRHVFARDRAIGALANGRGGAHVHFALRIRQGSIDAVQKRLEGLGYEVLRIEFGDGNRSLYLDDPDGNCLELMDAVVDWANQPVKRRRATRRPSVTTA